jgi:hypothetical protein
MSEHPLYCDGCGKEVHGGRGDYYAVSIVAVADPMPPVITDEEREADVSREIRRLIERLKGRKAEDLANEVVEEVSLRFCLVCFADWMDKIHSLRALRRD